MKNIKTWIRWFVLAAVAVLSTGCAVGVKYQLDTVAPDISTRSGSSLGLGVQDKREYVVSNNKPASFIGVMRSNAGIPYSVNTASGKPLADEFTQAITTALGSKGTKVTTVALPLGTDEAAAISRVASAGQKGLVLVVKEWKTDTYRNTWIEYDIQATVVDASGKVVATKKLVGNDNLGTASNSLDHARSAAPAVFRKKIEELFSAPEIASNL